MTRQLLVVKPLPEPAQIVKTLGATSIRYRSDTFVSNQYQFDIDPMAFVSGSGGVLKFAHSGTQDAEFSES